jgi:hypothetical protein
VEVLFQSDANTEVVDSEGRRAIEVTHNQTIKKLLQKKAEMYKAPPPFIVRGVLFRATSLTYRLKERTLFVNPFKNEFTLTDGKKREEKW